MTYRVTHRAVVTRLAMLAAACCVVGPVNWAFPEGAPAQTIERLRGIYLQQTIQVATIDDRPILLTRMTKFRRCGTKRAIAEDFNDHIVEVLGVTVPGLGFVAGIVDAVWGCDRTGANRP